MISEKKFVSKYHSFWSSALPLAEPYIRRINLTAFRFEKEMPAIAPLEHRGFVNELGFRLMANGRDADINEIVQATLEYIAPLGPIPPHPLPTGYLEEAELIAKRGRYFLESYFPGKTSLFFMPVPGCGILQKSFADVISGQCIIEVKAGDRNFRSIDFRQALVYATSINLSSPLSINEICVVNVRRGKYVLADINELCSDMGAGSFPEFSEKFEYYLASQQASN